MKNVLKTSNNKKYYRVTVGHRLSVKNFTASDGPLSGCNNGLGSMIIC